MAGENEKPGLLDSCFIYFVQSKSLSASLISELSKLVQKHGAQVLEPTKDGKIPLEHATHIVANTIDFEQYHDALQYMIPVVNTNWIKITLARNKVAQVRPYSPDPRMIFSNVILTCADIPESDKETIIGATMALGGMESKDLTRQTTHICALSMDHEKCQEAQKKNPKCKIVLPHWFDDCFRLGRRISEAPYMLPDPEILRTGPDEDIKIPTSEAVEGATSVIPSAVMPGKEREKVVVFAQKKVMISQDLPINARLRNILNTLIEQSDGEVVDDVDACDMYVCQYRDGDDYQRAAQQGKDVGNLAWLYYLIVHNEWTRPTRRLLHYPIPRAGIPGFQNMKITLSNYGGDARVYLENLITAAGATYTKTMKADNTHLITARMNGEKCEAAKEWNIEIVNHLWIEDSYAKCEAQTFSNPRYQHFPPRTNLGEIIGSTFFDEQKLREVYFPGGEEALSTAAKKRRKANDAANKNVDASNLAETDAGIASESSPLGSKAASRPPRGTQNKQNLQTPAKTTRTTRNGKENHTPSVMSSGSRSAKDKALSKLHQLAPDIALYEKEKKRTGKDGPWGGKRAADQIDRDRSVKESSPAEGEDEEDETGQKRPAKKARVSSGPVEMRICLTGYKRWVNDKMREEADRRKLRAMGIQIVQDNVPCDYLAAPRMVRTMKFLRCLARGPEVISSDFVTACIEAGKVLPIKDYLLVDKENEARFGVTLETAISRARANRSRLLWGVPIFCTAEIKNGVQSYQTIAEANGAIFKVFRGRGGSAIKPTTPEEDGGAPPEPVYLLTSPSAAEKALWPKFEEMAKKGNMEPRIVVSDWLLDVAMKQELTFDPKYLAVRYFAENPPF
ncbi:BRCT domain-containing protein [Neurospora tetraspora]|uniref:BRCT domain-containing protein n=1 Tax=Neurospora tetraspora TaxID=94610 RepID=A0AAE0MR03_9PEZI|nr:BRCT domain-containing protein [Neurospora tetraspora]